MPEWVYIQGIGFGSSQLPDKELIQKQKQEKNDKQTKCEQENGICMYKTRTSLKAAMISYLSEW